MDLNEVQREDLARRAHRVRIERFGGKKNAAYGAAGVNSNTWERMELAQPIAERSLVAIVRMLWPETAGDWRDIDPPLGGDVDVAEQVRRSNDLTPAAKELILQRMGDLVDESDRLVEQDERRRA